MINNDILITLNRLERSGDKVLVAFELEGKTHKLPTPMTIEEARAALQTADSLGATRVSITRFDTI